MTPTPSRHQFNLEIALAEQRAAQLARSDAMPPTIEPGVSVTLWGTNAGNQNQAGIEAMKALDLGANQITLVDRTPVETNELIGTRYVFRAVSA